MPPGGHLETLGPNGPDVGRHARPEREIRRADAATLGAGRWGQLDLAGNLWEGNLDDVAAFVDPCTDCANVGMSNILGPGARGGAAISAANDLYPSNRSVNWGGRSDIIGFRCARSP